MEYTPEKVTIEDCLENYERKGLAVLLNDGTVVGFEEVKQMAYYNVCPKCGAHLDAGEHCDCENESDVIKQLQSELDRRNNVENKAIDLISQCRFQEAIDILESCTSATGEQR